MSYSFNTRIDNEFMTLFRRAAQQWAERQAPGILSRRSAPLTRWMISVLVPAAQEELGKGKKK